MLSFRFSHGFVGVAFVLSVAALSGCGRSDSNDPTPPTATRPAPADTATPLPTATHTAAPTATSTAPPSATATSQPTATHTSPPPTETSTATPTASLTATFTATLGATPTFTVDPTPTSTGTATPIPTFAAHGSVEQIYVTDAAPGSALQLLDTTGQTVQRGTADAQGSFIFRHVPVGRGYVVTMGSGDAQQVS